MTKANSEKPRPVSIQIASIIGVIGAIGLVLVSFSPRAKTLHPDYPLFVALCAPIQVACFVGYWKMKKWGPIAYVVFTLLSQLGLIWLGVWRAVALIGPAIFAAIGLANLKKMS
jgi:hypothetical protein